ncbi:hypothetical protein GXM_03208 [Nostoc sphaeroides CCNUC1]|uniref:Uncharacterized protein n=1 Tax=Nostoc sphaeroides CCNUC1 TaxID=2653204 RepID=A0A5P8VZH5_9NOSO|nr:hypothetical protein GXM_03208 [Nostoc sphaeroides CCNUC1]
MNLFTLCSLRLCGLKVINSITELLSHFQRASPNPKRNKRKIWQLS